MKSNVATQIAQDLARKIATFEPTVDTRRVGRISAVADGVAKRGAFLFLKKFGEKPAQPNRHDNPQRAQIGERNQKNIQPDLQQGQQKCKGAEGGCGESHELPLFHNHLFDISHIIFYSLCIIPNVSYLILDICYITLHPHKTNCRIFFNLKHFSP